MLTKTLQNTTGDSSTPPNRPPSDVMRSITDLTAAFTVALTRLPLMKSAVPAETTLAALLVETIFTADDIYKHLADGATKRLEYIYEFMYDEVATLETAFRSLRNAMARAVLATHHSDATDGVWLAMWRLTPQAGPTSEKDAMMTMCEHARKLLGMAHSATVKTLSTFEDKEVMSIYKTMRGAYVTSRQQDVRMAVSSWTCQTPRRDRTTAAIDQQAAQSFDLLMKSRFLAAKMNDVDVRAPEDEGDAYTIDGETFSYHSARELLMREPGRSDGTLAKGTLDERMAEAAYKRLMGDGEWPDADAVGRYIVAQRAWLDRESIYEFFAHNERMAMLNKLRPKQPVEAPETAETTGCETKKKKKAGLSPQQKRILLKPHEKLFTNEDDFKQVRQRIKAVMAFLEMNGNKLVSDKGQKMTATQVVISAFFALCLDHVLVEMPPKKTWHTFLSDECGIKEPQLQSVRTLNDEMNKVAGGTPCVNTISKCLQASPKWRDFVDTFRRLYAET